MKITLISTGLEVGGGEKQVCDLADQFSSKGHLVQLISLTGKTVLSPKSSMVELIELQATKAPLSLVQALLKAKKHIDRFEPDVVHSHMIHANIFSRFLKLIGSSAPLVCTAHSTNEGGSLRTLAYRYTDWLCNLNTNVSEEAVKVYLDKKTCKPGKIVALVNGIDVDKFHFDVSVREDKRKLLELGSDEMLFLAVGRLSEAKDYPNLLDAFSELIASHNVKAKLAIVGVGELEEEIKAKVHDMNLSNSVRFLGLQPDVENWMCAADIFVMSSAWEGLPLVLLEAMACERVVVATDCGGIRGAVQENGKVVPTRNSNALARALATYIELPASNREKLGKLAREYIVDNYSLSAVAEKWISIYRSL